MTHATSATSAMLSPVHIARVGVVGVFLFASGLSARATTSTDHPCFIFERTATVPAGQIESVQVDTPASAILEIRRRSGLTWQELSDLFGVSRRSVHHWASGKVVSANHDRFIRQVLVTIRNVDHGAAALTRDFLLTPDADGVTAIDLLSASQSNEVMTRARDVSPIIANRRMPLSHAAQEARRPPPPAFLLGAIEDRPVVSGKTRVARAVRVPKATG